MRRWTTCASLFFLPAVLWGALPDNANSAEARGGVEAIAGEPFGVGRMVVEIPKDALPEPLDIEGLGLTEKDGRVLFPVFSTPILGALAKEVLEGTPLLTGGPVRREVRGFLNELLSRPPHTTIYFLFRGAEPLELTLQTRVPRSFTVKPTKADPAAHGRLLQTWWSEYTAPAHLLQKKPDYPPLVENYLKSTLARRMNLRLPKKEQTESPRELVIKELGLLLGSESILIAMEQDRLLGLHNLALSADQPLPAAIAPPPLEVPEPAAKVEVEPLALRVPPECFYVRFGSFSNFLWLQDTLTTWGGDLQNLLAVRGLDYGMKQHMEKQLVLQTTVLGRMLGDAVIADVAIIGNDTFFREGAAYGILFQARDNATLAADIARQRAARVQAGGVSEAKIKIGEQVVSYLSAPDGSVRSYYAAVGDYHFVGTSKALMRRFLETAAGGKGLGATREFRHARTIMPLDRKDAVWVYLSDGFFRNLTSPHYRIEMVRRLQAQADIEVVQLAALAAATEGKAGGSIEKLVAGGLLPPDFGPRPDGSRAVLKGGDVYDSLRGWRGSLLPVPDMPVTAATKAEITEYGKFAEFYAENWGRMDPTIIGLRRQALPGNREQVTVDLLMNPLQPKHYELLSQLAGPAQKTQLAPIAGDIARLDFVMPDQRIFAGLRDVALPLDLSGGKLELTGRLRDILVGYIGTTGPLGVLAVLNQPIILPPDARGNPGLRLGPLWQKKGEFSVFSLQPEVLKTVVPQLRFEQASQPAQLRVWIGDVAQAKIMPLANNIGYVRTRDTSLGNLRLLHDLDQQLHVPPRTCKEAAEFLTAAKLVCPLGGEYVYHESPGETGHWTTTALMGVGERKRLLDRAPDGYQAPPLNWFRGLSLDATMTQKVLSARAEVIMQLPAKKAAAK